MLTVTTTAEGIVLYVWVPTDIPVAPPIQPTQINRGETKSYSFRAEMDGKYRVNIAPDHTYWWGVRVPSVEGTAELTIEVYR